MNAPAGPSGHAKPEFKYCTLKSDSIHRGKILIDIKKMEACCHPDYEGELLTSWVIGRKLKTPLHLDGSHGEGGAV